MKPNAKQIRWLKKFLPKGVVPVDLIPRAYCVLKPAPGHAAFVTPWHDYRKHLAKKDRAEYYSGEVIHAAPDNPCVYDLRHGDWVSLVYATTPDTGLWYCTPVPIPWKMFETK